MVALDQFYRNEPSIFMISLHSNIDITKFYNTSTNFTNFNNNSGFFNPYYNSSLNIANIACYDFTNSTSSTSCNDHFILNNIAHCWIFSPFHDESNQNCNITGHNCTSSSKENYDLGLNYIILNITSDTSSPANLSSDYFSIITRSKYNSLFSKGFGFDPENKEVFIDTEIKELQPTVNSSYTILLLKPKNNTIYNEGETFDYTSGIPFADSPRKLQKGATIEDRVSVLEYVLRKYYLDTDCFTELNYVIQQNREYEEKFKITKS
ncbi:hypothetical protein C2G38_2250745 [Gigaspora rosea]|uniref:Uncharacterized protein n=1 Tax=Gigaspora rosea TaxID=44941 RepID=A0A397UMT6_9GLOM|nr:hypothetical protein C2G38_2250745 [Gigaspora rosea]